MELRSELIEIVNDAFRKSINHCFETIQVNQDMNLKCNASDILKDTLETSYQNCISDAESSGMSSTQIEQHCPESMKYSCVFKDIRQQQNFTLNTGCEMNEDVQTNFRFNLKTALEESFFTDGKVVGIVENIEREYDISREELIDELVAQLTDIQVIQDLFSAYSASQSIEVGGTSIFVENVSQTLVANVIDNVLFNNSNSNIISRFDKELDKPPPKDNTLLIAMIVGGIFFVMMMMILLVI
jgi:hypothetical protein